MYELDHSKPTTPSAGPFLWSGSMCPALAFFKGLTMQKIPLTQNQYAIIDAKDYQWINQWKWSATWNSHTNSYYAKRNSSRRSPGKRHTIAMHREILGLKHGNKLQVDHIDHNTLDNRRKNLRTVTNRGNQNNRRNKRSSFPGVSWNKQMSSWRSHIHIEGVQLHLGYFHSEFNAGLAYQVAKRWLAEGDSND